MFYFHSDQDRPRAAMASSNSCHRHGLLSGTKLESKSYGEEVIGKLRHLQESDELCDFTITADGRSFRVSR